MATERNADAQPRRRLEVVLFSGGRGSGALAGLLVAHPDVSLTVAINGYDDGASTGAVRRLLGDSLGPSDFRKNASRLASALQTCPPALVELLDLRLPEDVSRAGAIELVGAATADGLTPTSDAVRRIQSLSRAAGADASARIGARIERFLSELTASQRAFDFSDCSFGNLVFAGGFLLCGRRFNAAVDDYCGLVGLPPGIVENVTDGTNAYLVAVDADGRLLATEEEIVDNRRASRIKDIFLVPREVTAGERQRYGAPAMDLLAAAATAVPLNPRLAAKIASSDLIIYAPGTQHSSLFPSYLTQGLSAAIAANLSAIKLLVTNIETDAEIAGSSAVEIIERAVYYLEEKGRLAIPTPCLITHYLVNDPGRPEPGRPYVPLGPLDSIEDPRLVRVANYEDGITGRHDAARVLTPFIDAIARRGVRRRIAVLLHDAGSLNKVAQTLLEMVRGGIEHVPADVTVYYPARARLEAQFASSLPFAVEWLPGGEADFASVLRRDRLDYVVLFESSGMYRGEDIVGLASQLAIGRFDAVWGSRRLSVRDIQESYRLRYRGNVLLGAISYVGSHVLSLAYLVCYGRYISDTLSAVRGVRASDAVALAASLTHKNANHLLLSRLLERKADLLEIPVAFYPLSPERVKRTTMLDGLRALSAIVRHRLSGAPRGDAEASAPAPALSDVKGRQGT